MSEGGGKQKHARYYCKGKHVKEMSFLGDCTIMSNEKYNYSMSPQIILRSTWISGCWMGSHTVLQVLSTDVNALLLDLRSQDGVASSISALKSRLWWCRFRAVLLTVILRCFLCSVPPSAWLAHMMLPWDYNKANTKLYMIMVGAHCSLHVLVTYFYKNYN